VLLAKAANAVGLRLAVVWLLVSRLPFNPVELFEEPESLLRRSATFLSGLEGLQRSRRTLHTSSAAIEPIVAWQMEWLLSSPSAKSQIKCRGNQLKSLMRESRI
jgi:hypothetical protein